MRKVTSADKTIVVDILTRAYQSNPTVLRVVKGQDPGRIPVLFDICFDEALLADGVHITSDNMGVAFLYESQKRKGMSLRNSLRMFREVTGFKLGLRAWKREKMILSMRPKTPHLHFWMMAVDPDQKGIATVQEIRDFAFSWSDKSGLPIYGETPMERTRNIYVRYGFEEYKMVVAPDNYTLWFLHRNPKTSP